MSADEPHHVVHILGKAVTGKETTEAEVIQLMLRGVTKDGKKITFEMMELFNEHSKKNLSDLVDELNEGEATLYIGRVDPWPNRVIREARSVKFTIINPETHMWLREVFHSYKGAEFFSIPKNFNNADNVKLIEGNSSGSETIIHGETPDQAFVRGLEQELDLHPGDYEVVGKIVHALGDFPGRPNFHDSNTYAHVHSREWIVAEFTAATVKLGSNSPTIKNDHGKTTLRIWEISFPFHTNLTIAQLRELGFDC